MVSFSTLVLTYVVGGITFVPLCIAAFLAFLFYSSPVVLHSPPSSPSTAPKPSPSDLKTASTHDDSDDQEPVTVYRAGWITARRTYEPLLPGANEGGTYVGMLASGYRSFMDNRSKDPRRSKPKDRFFAVLKQNLLFLYESEEMLECWAAIEVSSHDVVVYPEGYVDGEFWVKRTAIELKPKVGGKGSEDKEKEKEKEADTNETADENGQEEKSLEGTTYDAETGKPLPWFIFAKVNSDKEDWYHSLVIASRIGTPTCATETARDRSLFSTDDMAHLVDSIDSLPESIPMRWFNAILGRVFLAVYRTSSLESYITSRIVRKLKRVKIPSMLSEIQVREVDVGSSTPLFSKPMLKELTTDGEASMECHVSYVGAVRITIETVATVSISSRFKPYSVRLVLAVVLQELEGTLLVKIKKPPSNRIWFGFTAMPKIKMAVEPVVSTRQLKWSMVTSPIESRIREVIAESIVLPHMDDLSFFSTLPFPSTARGGIFGAALRKERPDLNVPASSNTSDPTSKGEHDLVSIPPNGEEPELEIEEPTAEGKKEKAKMVEGILMSEGKETVDRARQRIRRASSGSSMAMDEERDTFKAQLDSARSPTRKPSSIKSTNSVATSTSVSSLAGLASAKITSWRDSKREDQASMGTASSEGRDRMGGPGTDKKRTSSWFAKSNPPSPAAPPATNSSATSLLPTPSRTDSSSSDSNRSTATTTSSSFVPIPLNETDATPTPSKPPLVSTPSSIQPEEVSAAKLREILTKRAESREREKKEKEIALQEEESALNKVLPPLTPDRQLSNLSRTAPDNSKPLPSISVDPSSPSSNSPIIPDLAPAEPAPAQPEREVESKTPPALPSRPAWIKSDSSESPPPPVSSSPSSLPPPPPPIRRSPSHNASVSVDSSSTAASATTTASLLSSWRAKAADKEALAQSVLQAKESMRKWGAGWNARRTAGRPADAEGAGLLTEERPLPPKEEEEEGYRDYRKRAKSGIDDYYGPSSSREASPPASPRRPSHTKSASTASPSRMRASSIPSTSSTLANATAQFDSTTSSSPTAKLSAVQSSSTTIPPVKPLPVPSPSTSPSKPPGMMGGSGGGGYGYGRATMMQLPGIRDESRKKLVSEDHLGGGSTLPVVETKKDEPTNPPTKSPEPATTLATAEVTVLPKPSSTIEKTFAPGPETIPPPSLPPRQAPLASETTPAPVAPALPSRPEQPTVASAAPIEASPPKLPPTLPPRVQTPKADTDKLESLEDQAGWGLDEGEGTGSKN